MDKNNKNINEYKGNMYDNGGASPSWGPCVANLSPCLVDGTICGVNIGGCIANASACATNYGGCGANFSGCGVNRGGCGVNI